MKRFYKKSKILARSFILVSLVFLFVCLIFQNAQLVSGSAYTGKSPFVLSESTNGLTLQLTPENWTQTKVAFEGKEFTEFEFKNSSKSDNPGQPQVPFHSFVVGVPIGANVSYRIVDSEFEDFTNVELLPFPEYTSVEGTLTPRYIQDENTYNNLGIFPAERVQIGKKSFFRDQQIVNISVAAAQYFPKTKIFRKFKKIVLRLNFIGSRVAQVSPKKSGRSEEHLYESVLLNYNQARTWRKPYKTPDVSLSKFSPTQSGTYYKFKITEEGIYRVTGDFLRSNINNLDLNSINPAKIQIFNNGGKELPRDINIARPDGLVENAIVVNDGGDGNFDGNDTILFYGHGVEGWEFNASSGKFEHYINHYGFNNVYWLKLDGTQDGKRMQTAQSDQLASQVVDSYAGMVFVEEERSNPVRSGINWFGRDFAVDEFSRSNSWTLNLPNAITSEVTHFNFRFAALNTGRHTFNIRMNNNQIGTKTFNGLSLAFGQYLQVVTSVENYQQSNVVNPGDNTLRLDYSHSSTTGRAFLDWVDILYSARMIADENQLIFTVEPASGVQTYRASNFSGSEIKMFDVSNFENIRIFDGFSYSNGNVTFADSQLPNAPKRYAILNPSRYLGLEDLERVEFRNLRDPQFSLNPNPMSDNSFIIITHNDFRAEAERLESLRENANPADQLQTEVVLISDIYNNFSSGLTDVTAIRDFLKYAYDNWTPRPLYVLLLGDGDYDYKNIISKEDLNWIPSFQTDALETSSVIKELVSRANDSWYTYVSPDNDGSTPRMDLAIGRITAQTIADAKNVVDKIIAYETQATFGQWRNKVTIIGDDELVSNGNPGGGDDIHIRQAEVIAEQYIPKHFNLKKIYLSEYPKVRSEASGGVLKPAAKEDLIQTINKGSLIVNFIGHGNPQLWTHEQIFTIADNSRVQNQDKLMFFVAATCDWALFDRPDRQSQAEELLLAEKRGAVAILSSARLVFASQNFSFSKKFYSYLFPDETTSNRIGDAFLLARIDISSQVNDEKYHIFGDPTLRLANPEKQGVITKMNPDSILALAAIEIEGEVLQNGALDGNFNGSAFVNVFDSKKTIANLTENGGIQNYLLPGNSIYRGSVPVQSGRFKSKFIVPKDISYGGGSATASVYFWNDETDGAGSLNNIRVSSSTSELTDEAGPEIQIYFKEHQNFTTGDIVDENITMVIELADTVSGINIAGEIGHQLTLSIDPDDETCLSQLNRFNGVSTIDLTAIFDFNEGDHLRGKIEIPLQFPSEVEVGGNTIACADFDDEQRHTLVVKAWDNANNSSTASVEVSVVHEAGLVIKDVLNYPNPLEDETTFTFFVNRDAEVEVKIYTVAGQLIKKMEYPFARNGFNMIEWDGRDEQGDTPANGVYLYKIIAKAVGTSESIQKEKLGRLAIIR